MMPLYISAIISSLSLFLGSLGLFTGSWYINGLANTKSKSDTSLTPAPMMHIPIFPYNKFDLPKPTKKSLKSLKHKRAVHHRRKDHLREETKKRAKKHAKISKQVVKQLSKQLAKQKKMQKSKTRKDQASKKAERQNQLQQLQKTSKKSIILNFDWKDQRKSKYLEKENLRRKRSTTEKPIVHKKKQTKSTRVRKVQLTKISQSQHKLEITKLKQTLKTQKQTDLHANARLHVKELTLKPKKLVTQLKTWRRVKQPKELHLKLMPSIKQNLQLLETPRYTELYGLENQIQSIIQTPTFMNLKKFKKSVHDLKHGSPEVLWKFQAASTPDLQLTPHKKGVKKKASNLVSSQKPYSYQLQLPVLKQQAEKLQMKQQVEERTAKGVTMKSTIINLTLNKPSDFERPKTIEEIDLYESHKKNYVRRTSSTHQITEKIKKTSQLLISTQKVEQKIQQKNPGTERLSKKLMQLLGRTIRRKKHTRENPTKKLLQLLTEEVKIEPQTSEKPTTNSLRLTTQNIKAKRQTTEKSTISLSQTMKTFNEFDSFDSLLKSIRDSTKGQSTPHKNDRESRKTTKTIKPTPQETHKFEMKSQRRKETTAKTTKQTTQEFEKLEKQIVLKEKPMKKSLLLAIVEKNKRLHQAKENSHKKFKQFVTENIRVSDIRKNLRSSRLKKKLLKNQLILSQEPLLLKKQKKKSMVLLG